MFTLNRGPDFPTTLELVWWKEHIPLERGSDQKSFGKKWDFALIKVGPAVEGLEEETSAATVQQELTDQIPDSIW